MLGVPTSSATKRILVVEDNELNMKLLNDVLEAHGYDVLSTGEGAVAVADLAHGLEVAMHGGNAAGGGADDGFGFPGYDPAGPRPTVVQILNGEKPSNVGPVLFVRRPFAGQKYSGGGIEIMQLALTDLTGKAFADLMREKVLEPIGMANSTFQQPPEAAMAELTSRAHDGMGKAMGPKWHVYPEQAAAGLWTTPARKPRAKPDCRNGADRLAGRPARGCRRHRRLRASPRVGAG